MTAKIATPRSTSPSLFHGEVFLLFNSRTSSSCLLVAASLAAIVSFFAATAAFNASVSLLRVSFNSLSSADDCVSVLRRSESSLFSSSRTVTSLRVFASSSAVAAHALTRFSAAARVSEFREFGAEFGVCAFDCADVASTANAIASSISIVCQFPEFFILFPCYRFYIG